MNPPSFTCRVWGREARVPTPGPGKQTQPVGGRGGKSQARGQRKLDV